MDIYQLYSGKNKIRLSYQERRLNMNKKMIIITGCGRSGTLYMRKVFEVFGYDVGHEGLRQDGISSWYIVDPYHFSIVNRYINRRENTKDRDRVYIHLIRNPLDVISSFYRCEALPNRAGLNFFRRSTASKIKWQNFQELAFIAKYWIEWNKAAEKNFNFDMRIRVEDVGLNETIKKLTNKINIIDPFEIEYAIKEIKSLGNNIHTISPKNMRGLERYAKDRVKRISLDDIKNIVRAIAHEVLNMAEKYGYSL